ncbi:unnamed protein product [Miscanthus lutarioriparius]|uniref:Aminoacyl-tRNA synthetase class II (D/K/N) domain-containing protein n=1 Tax=Miscanthus lutarioriparius TaxID=422564 RepID=A0A811P668_9POAL|nr:unnamed protein product [Miscanthus lutarioriparius]
MVSALFCQPIVLIVGSEESTLLDQYWIDGKSIHALAPHSLGRCWEDGEGVGQRRASWTCVVCVTSLGAFTVRVLAEFFQIWHKLRHVQLVPGIPDVFRWRLTADEKIFKHLNENCKEELEAINKQYPFEPLKYLDQTLELTYEEGIQMLKDAGTATTPMDDLNTDAEKKLGQLVKEKYGTDFFILYGYPLAVRPFYTMPCYDNPAYSNSFDVFIRGLLTTY